MKHVDMGYIKENNNPNERSADIAIVGMSCLFPGAPDLNSYWQNIVSKVDAITEPPEEAWNLETFHNPASGENDRVYCGKGGFIGPHAYFDPLAYGIMPTTVQGGEPDQWLALRIAHAALLDAGHDDVIPDRQRTAVIIGKGTYLNRGNFSVVQHGRVIDQTIDIIQSLHPEYGPDALKSLRQRLKKQLPHFNADTASGLVPNIIAGRIANHFDLMGPSYTVDAACASSLLAIDHAVRDLTSYRCDMALVGGTHVVTPVPILMLFCQLNALSRREQIRPFDIDADGTILSEGVGIIVLKRLEDAIQSGQRIYAVIKGVGTSSDGMGMSVMAPRKEGEVLAIRRAYDAANIPPQSIGLLEAHGTGTPVGDATEVDALTEVFGQRIGNTPHCALGSVKSMIGHAMPAAGIAGLIKAALALHQKVLPPTLNVDTPNPKLDLNRTPFYLNTETRPWIHGAIDEPRRAGVNAFGFGGINAHVVLEEATVPSSVYGSCHLEWETEVYLLTSDIRSELIVEAEQLLRYLTSEPEVCLKDLAYTLNKSLDNTRLCLAIVAGGHADLREKLDLALTHLQNGERHQIKDKNGIYFSEKPLKSSGQLAFVFPGEGSQYVNMMADLCLHFPEVRRHFDQIDQVFMQQGRTNLPSEIIFPRPSFNVAEQQQTEQEIWQMDGAIEAVLSANRAFYSILQLLKIEPDCLVGHSSGEYSAMLAADAINLLNVDLLQSFCTELHQIYAEASDKMGIPSVALIAVAAHQDKLSVLINEIREETDSRIYIAMSNCPHQTVLACEESMLHRVRSSLDQERFIYEQLPFDRPYHTPLFSEYTKRLEPFVHKWIQAAPKIPTYSCTTGALHSNNVEKARQVALEHWVAPVEFAHTIETMHNDGVRIFLEVGASGNLSSFIGDILRGKPHLACPINTKNRIGITQLNHTIGMLAAHGVSMNVDYLYQYRDPQEVQLNLTDNQSNEQNNEKSKKHLPIKIATGWPSLSLEEDAARAIRKELPIRADDQRSAVDQRTLINSVESKNGIRLKIDPEIEVSDGELSDTQLESIENAYNSPNSEQSMQSLQADAVTPSPVRDYGSTSAQQADGVMSNHFQIMEQFLSTQEEVMGAFLSGAQSPHPPQHALPGANDRPQAIATPNEAAVRPQQRNSSAPFLSEIVSLTPGESLIARYELNAGEAIFLHDHALGRNISAYDLDLHGLLVMPFTMVIELLAEAASLLAPEQNLVLVQNMSMRRWITLEDDAALLTIVAERKPTDSASVIHVYVIEAESVLETEDAINTTAHAQPIAETQFTFCDVMPASPQLDPARADGKQTLRSPQKQLYRNNVMFHGPKFQGVASLDHVDDQGAKATLTVLPFHDLFHSQPNPALITDPVLLDQPGQVVGFWAAQKLADASVIFPYHLASLEFFGDRLQPAENASCHASIELVGIRQMRSNLDIVDANDELRIRFTGWENLRFDISARFLEFMLDPKEVTLSNVTSSVDHAPNVHFAATCSLHNSELGPNFFGEHSGIWQRVLAHLILSRNERKVWHELDDKSVSRSNWLMERVAAKDAARHFAAHQYGAKICPADIELVPNQNGSFAITGPWFEKIPDAATISIEHENGSCVGTIRVKTVHVGASEAGTVSREPIRAL